MATDVMSLFNMPSQEQLGRNYLEGMLTSPQQMGAQGLLQQVVSLGGNAGSMLGYGAGRLMGGMTADEVRAKSIDEAMRDVQGMGLKSDAEMYAALSQQLASRGLTQDALQARNAALKAAQVEQGMAIEKEKLGISKEELGLRKSQEARETALNPLRIQQLQTAIDKDNFSMKTVEQKLAEALSTGDTAAAEGYQRELDQLKQERDLKVKQANAQLAVSNATLLNAQTQAAKAAQDSFSGKLVTEFTNPFTQQVQALQTGKPTKGGKIQGLYSNKFYTMDEWEAGGAIAEANGIRKQNGLPEVGVPTTPQPAPTKKSDAAWDAFLPPTYSSPL